MRATRSYVAGVGTTGALIGAIGCAFAVVSAVVAVSGWPLAPSAPGVATLDDRGGGAAAEPLLSPRGPLPGADATASGRDATTGEGVRWIAAAGGRTGAAAVGALPDAGAPDLRAGGPSAARRAAGGVAGASSAGAISPPPGTSPRQPLPGTGGGGSGTGAPAPTAGGTASQGGLGGAVTQVASGAGTAVAQTGQQLGGAVQGATGQLGGTVGQVSPAAGQVVTQTGQVAGGAVGGVTGAAGQVVSGAGTAVGGLLGGLGGRSR